MAEDKKPNENNINENVESAPKKSRPAFKKIENEDEFEQIVETKRSEFRKGFNKSKMISRIIMSGVICLLIAAIILVTLNTMVTQIIGYAVAGVILVGLVVYYFLSKTKFPNTSRIYIKEVTDIINGYIFKDDKFTDLVCFPDKKLSAVELSLDKAFKEGVEAGSRNTVKGKYNGKDFELSEAAIYYQNTENKRVTRQVGFLGKYLSMDNSLQLEGRYIFNLTGKDPEKLVDQPNDLDDLHEILREDNLVVYGPLDNKPIDKLFGKDFVKKIKDIDVTSPLLNAVLVIWGGHSAAYLSYDDPVTTLPFEKEFKKDAQEKYRADLMQVLAILDK